MISSGGIEGASDGLSVREEEMGCKNQEINQFPVVGMIENNSS